jgi:hypothetical protein
MRRVRTTTHQKRATVRLIPYFAPRFVLWKQLYVPLDVIYDDSDG